MQLYIPDACIILAFFLREKERGEKAKDFFQDVNNGKYSVLLPSIWFYEVGNKLGMLSTYEAKMYRDTLNFYRDHFFTTVHLDQETTHTAFSLMKKYKGITFYDASYHALALARKGTFLTCDKKYYSLAKKAGSIELF